MSGQNKQIARRSVEALAAGGAAALERIVAEDPRAGDQGAVERRASPWHGSLTSA
jgi:hypothetical protein